MHLDHRAMAGPVTPATSVWVVPVAISCLAYQLQLVYFIYHTVLLHNRTRLHVYDLHT